MATIRAYMTIEQSRKLAEILPLESADQTYEHITSLNAAGELQYKHEYKHNGDMPFQFYSGIGVPCWSLAALLDILPKIHGAKPILDLEENSIQYTGIDLYVVADNSVDACVSMIIKLHEHKKL